MLNFGLTDVNPVQSALAGNNLTIRLATEDYATASFATLETTNPDFSAASLTVKPHAYPGASKRNAVRVKRLAWSHQETQIAYLLS